MTGLVADTFAGPGGWDEGLRLLDYPGPVVGLEWDPHACATRAAAGHLTVRADVAAYPTAPFVSRTDGFIGSPPCQAFSLAGRKKGLGARDWLLAHVAACVDGWRPPPDELCAEDVRADLTLQPLRWVDALRPRWVALEQVPMVAPLWAAVGEILEAWGYSTATGILNAADYGVPQTRRRAVLLARRDGVPARLPETTHYDPAAGVSLLEELEGHRPWVTAAEALELDGLVIDRRMGNALVVGEARPAPTVTGSAGGRSQWKLELVEGVTSNLEPDDRRRTGEWLADRPATTVTRTPALARPGHRAPFGAGAKQFDDGSWRLSLEAAARLQTFPDGYPWQGPKGARHLQVGNAVPPVLAAALLAPFVR